MKRLLVSDPGKRIGNLKDGIIDIKNHKFYLPINWNHLLEKKLFCPFIPEPRTFSNIDEKSIFSDFEGDIIPNESDPFLQW